VANATLMVKSMGRIARVYYPKWINQVINTEINVLDDPFKQVLIADQPFGVFCIVTINELCYLRHRVTLPPLLHEGCLMNDANRSCLTIKDFATKQDGNIAVFTALLSIPLLLAVGYSVDIANLTKERTRLQAAADNAVLAAVLPHSLNDDERETFALNMFYDNYFLNMDNNDNENDDESDGEDDESDSEDDECEGDDDEREDENPIFPPEITADADATRNQVELNTEIEIPSLFGGIIGKDKHTVAVSAKAALTTNDTVCALALDPTGEGSIEFTDNSTFRAPTCSVQANSTHKSAIISSSSRRPEAKSFCSVGGSNGFFDPFIKNNCSPIDDPYKDKEIPPPASNCDQFRTIIINGNNTSAPSFAVSESELTTTETGVPIIPTGTVLQPGIYCKGMQINGANVTLQSGEYHIWGDLEFTQNASIVGDGVTFILKGTNNRLLVEDGAQAWLRAPNTGPTAGLVFWQIHLNFFAYVFGWETPPPEGVTAISEIRNGGGMTIIGNAYFPNHELRISSDSPTQSNSPATSFIAYRLKFEGEAFMNIRVDHVAGGVPPLEPRSDEGARLVR